jgi:hypothetical protein
MDKKTDNNPPEYNIFNEEQTADQRYDEKMKNSVDMEQIPDDDAVFILMRSDKYKYSKKLLMKCEYFGALFSRWVETDKVPQYILPNDIDPIMFRELIYKLRFPNHPIKYKVLLDYYDYFGLNIDTTSSKSNKKKLFINDTIMLSESKTFTKDIRDIVSIKFIIYSDIFDGFSYNSMRGFYKPSTYSSPIDADNLKNAEKILSDFQKSKDYYFTFRYLDDNNVNSNPTTNIFPSDMELRSVSQDRKGAGDGNCTFNYNLVSSKSIIQKSPKKAFEIKVFGKTKCQIDINYYKYI